MKRGAGSYIRNEDGELEENLEDPVMKERKEIREKKSKEKKSAQPEEKTLKTETFGTRKRPVDKQEAKLEIIAAMKEVIDIGENLISGGRPAVKAVEEILGYQISEAERNDLMEVFNDVS